MRTFPLIFIAFASLAFAQTPPASPLPANPDEKALQEAGLSADGPALLDFFRTRTRAEARRDRLEALVRDLGSPAADVHGKATAELVALGVVAVPVLRGGVHDLDSPDVARRARRCLELIDGPSGAALTAAAVRVLGAKNPPGTTEVLLAFLPFADDAGVADAVSVTLAGVAYSDGKPDAALVRGLADPVPLRRAVAVEALCRADHPEQFADLRKLMSDPKPAVRARAALALARQNDVEAVPVLIELIAELPPETRKEVESLLGELAGEWAPGVALSGDDAISRRIRRDVWAAWWRNTDGPALLAEFRKHTLTPQREEQVRATVRRLGDSSYFERERAADELVAVGTAALPELRQAVKSTDPEVARRAQACVQRLERGEANPLPTAAARLVALRRPEGAAEALLGYVPFAEGDSLSAEVITALAAVAVRDGKPDPAVLAALDDKMPARRAAAAEALCRAASGVYAAAALKLLQDADATVRLRAASALAAARRRDAVPVLIDLLGAPPREQAAQAQEILAQLAGDKAPPAPAEETDAARRKYRAAWAAWWKADGDKADLSRLTSSQTLLGYTMIVLVDNNGLGRVVELGRDGKPRWEITGLLYPVDAYVLPGGGRVLVTEYNGRKVTERDLKGNVVWEKTNLPSQVVNAQRLANGNTFIACTNRLVEVDRTGKEVWTYARPGNDIAAAVRAPNGQTTVLTNNTCLRLDAAGKEVKSFAMNAGGSWTSRLDLLPRGHVLLALTATNKVGEFDADGKMVWSTDAPQVTTATRLANGNTLVASHQGQRVYEINREGKTVWEHKDTLHPFRARRR